ncbi:hypothetical protein PIB30_096779, partial [Stylosanthes scabra]|nr:hypothetical protein [Stylosanthes scabra]
MVINVFKAMQYPGEDDAENCMRIDGIDMLIKEILEEDTLLKSNAKYEIRLNALEEANHESVLQEKGRCNIAGKANNGAESPTFYSQICFSRKRRKFMSYHKLLFEYQGRRR